MEKQTQDKFLDFVEHYLVIDGAKCYRHCEQPAKFTPIFQSESSLVGAYVCPQGYVSRVVYFAANPDAEWFKEFLRNPLGEKRVKTQDIRSATRHGWELGGTAEAEISKVAKSGTITQYYWTFYPKTNEEKSLGTFLCPKEEGGCGRLYTKLNTEDSRLCPNCRNA